MGTYIGIDLGTTFSVAAYIDRDGKPQVVQNSEGERITPSAVLFDGSSWVVGKEAWKASVAHHDDFVAFVKREMGKRNKRYRIDGQDRSPEEISSVILKKIRLDVESVIGEHGPVQGAVVTVPAYFTEPQRRATMDAAEIAGIPVLAIINEPTAAALAYSYRETIDRQQVFLVYDLGGGTFDVSVCRVDGQTIEVLNSDGNHELGGYDFDRMIVDWFIGQARERGADVNQDPEARQELMIKAEEAKKTLSTRMRTTISVTVQGQRIQAELTREKFEDMISPLIYTTIALLDDTVERAGIELQDIDKILLVGGSTRIPLVKRMIEEETHIKPSEELHPDEVVAIGAAYHADSLARKTKTKPVDPAAQTDEKEIPGDEQSHTFIDRTTHGIGVVVWNPEMEIEENSIVLPKNSVMPASAEQMFTTLQDYGTSLLVRVTEGEESDMRYTTIIGTAEMKLRPKPAHSPIRVIISCDTNSIIHVNVYDVADQTDLGEIKIERSNNMNEREVREARERVGMLDIG